MSEIASFLRMRFGPFACFTATLPRIELIEVLSIERRPLAGRCIVALVKVPPYSILQYTFVCTDESWEDH